MADFHVDAEVGTLKKVLMCQPGIEMYLGATQPREKALHLQPIDILVIRNQWDALRNAYERRDIEVVDYKQVLASTRRSEVSMTVGALLGKIVQRYPEVDSSVLERLLEEDVGDYGEAGAVAMNALLVGDETNDEDTLFNAVFTCDPGMLVGPVCILSNMRDHVRQREVDVYETVMKALGHTDLFKVTDGVFEGGDGMVMNGAFYSGVGSRSTPSAIRQIGAYLHDRFGMDTWMIHIPDAKNIPPYVAFLRERGQDPNYDGNMRLMHWDTFGMEVDRGLVYGCGAIMEYCTVQRVGSSETEGLLPHLRRWAEFRDVPLEEQQNLAPNMTVVRPREVVGVNPYESRTLAQLKADGIRVGVLNLSEFGKFGGLGHCASGQLVKDTPWMKEVYRR